MASPTTASDPPAILKLLAHEVRWRLVQGLAVSDYRVHELVALLGKPMNLVSYHLRQLREGGLVSERRSAADARDIYYALNLERIDLLYHDAASALHPGLAPPGDGAEQSAAPPARVLFLCTHNSARSQLAEAILRHLGADQVAAASAGTAPGSIHPQTLATLAARGVDATGLAPKHLDQFAGQRFDYIVTVCDRARENCPIFPGDPERIHWSFADPAAPDEPAAVERAFEQTSLQLQTRLRYLLALIGRQRSGR